MLSSGRFVRLVFAPIGKFLGWWQAGCNAPGDMFVSGAIHLISSAFLQSDATPAALLPLIMLIEFDKKVICYHAVMIANLRNQCFPKIACKRFTNLIWVANRHASL